MSGKNGQSFKKRLHYPLFRVPENADFFSGLETHGAGELLNGSFKKKWEKSNEPAGWEKLPEGVKNINIY
jgi:hypothetical protein